MWDWWPFIAGAACGLFVGGTIGCLAAALAAAAARDSKKRP